MACCWGCCSSPLPSAQQQPQQQARQWSREELAAKLEALRRSSRTASERLGAQTLEGWRGHADHAERWGRQELAEGRQAEGEGLLRYAAEERRLLQEAVEDHIADRRRDMTDRTLSAMRAEAEQARARGDERTRRGLEAAKARGVRFGPPARLCAAQLDHARELIGEGRPVSEIARLLGVHRATLYRALARAA